jgi:hypothetical protein
VSQLVHHSLSHPHLLVLLFLFAASFDFLASLSSIDLLLTIALLPTLLSGSGSKPGLFVFCKRKQTKHMHTGAYLTLPLMRHSVLIVQSLQNTQGSATRLALQQHSHVQRSPSMEIACSQLTTVANFYTPRECSSESYLYPSMPYSMHVLTSLPGNATGTRQTCSRDLKNLVNAASGSAPCS